MTDQGIPIVPRVFEKASAVYASHLDKEWSAKLQGNTAAASEWMSAECTRLVCVRNISDDTLMLRFSSGIFANARTMLAICQQWERMALHIIAPEKLAGEGRVWIMLLHLMLCEPNLEQGIDPMFQGYQTMVYLMGTSDCPFMELLYTYNFFEGTPLDIEHEQDRVISPAFLRFHSHYLPTISGRMAFLFLGARNCFTSTSYAENSNTSYLQSCLRESLAAIYDTLFNHFRPCILACMLVAICWGACSRGEVYRASMSESIAHLLAFIDRMKLQMEQHLRAQQVSRHEEHLLRVIAQRVSILKKTIDYFQIDCKTSGYSLLSLDALFRARWTTLFNRGEPTLNFL